ncbi:MAG: prepilin-type N-terminal cleavage/methylation domain-containing protein [Leptolyngbya sp. SIOISBB]|nr:prepilin-type N-terminal cleavage/methylation domain-containing protein [Leptolyngbya sp. SIOISBB]
MKTSFTYNLLKHLRDKKAQGGFTLIELLVVIIIIGILAAIALPAFLNQANRARESEAANYVGAANRGQQAYYLEELTYAPNVSDMDVGIETATQNYTYGDAVGGGTAGAFDLGLANSAVMYGSPAKTALKGFGGQVYSDVNSGNQVVLLCRETAAGDLNATAIVAATPPVCPGGTEDL